MPRADNKPVDSVVSMLYHSSYYASSAQLDVNHMELCNPYGIVYPMELCIPLGGLTKEIAFKGITQALASILHSLLGFYIFQKSY